MGVESKITVRDSGGPRYFHGYKMVDLSWSAETALAANKLRWTDLILYRVTDKTAPWKYVLQSIGRSVVYHVPGNPCNRGIDSPVGILYEDRERYDNLLPCNVPGCRPKPLEDLDDHDRVSVEEDRYKLNRCTTPDDIMDALRIGGVISDLGQRLLVSAAAVDADIAEATQVERPL